MPIHDIVVMGASAGGVNALRTVLSGLPKELPASIFVTIHMMPTAGEYLGEVLGEHSHLPVMLVRDNEEIRPGRVYVAAPNLHLTVKRGYVRSRFLPKENGSRPAIDPMFRSAAHSYSRRVIGVLLTGNLDDGAAGLGVIQDEGGITVVQDPKDALHPDMPLSAIKSIRPDHIVPLAELSSHIAGLVRTEVAGQAPTEERESKQVDHVMTCPGCGGVLREYVNDKLIWFECRVGHRYTSETLVLEQNAAVEEQVWRLLALLNEKADTARTMVADARATTRSLVDPEYFERQLQAAVQAQERISSVFDELGPTLFPGVPKKEIPKMTRKGGPAK